MRSGRRRPRPAPAAGRRTAPLLRPRSTPGRRRHSPRRPRYLARSRSPVVHRPGRTEWGQLQASRPASACPPRRTGVARRTPPRRGQRPGAGSGSGAGAPPFPPPWPPSRPGCAAPRRAQSRTACSSRRHCSAGWSAGARSMARGSHAQAAWRRGTGARTAPRPCSPLLNRTRKTSQTQIQMTRRTQTRRTTLTTMRRTRTPTRMRQPDHARLRHSLHSLRSCSIPRSHPRTPSSSPARAASP